MNLSEITEPKRALKHAFCLPGGGAKAAVQLGAINRCLELGVEGSLYVTTSGGSPNGAMAAMRKYDELNAFWRQTGDTAGRFIFESYLAQLQDGTVRANVAAIRDILAAGLNFGDKIGLITKKGQRSFIDKIINNAKGIDHLLDNAPLKETLLAQVRMADMKADFYPTFVSLYDGQLHCYHHSLFKDDRNLALAVLASTSIPGVCAPVPEIHLADGTVIYDCVDGGLRASSPFSLTIQHIDPAYDWAAWAIDNNSVNQQLNKSKKNLVTQAGGSVDIMLNDGLGREIKMTKKINEWALKYPEFRAAEGIKVAKILHIEAPLDAEGYPLLGSTMDFRSEWIDKRIAIGYESVNEFFKLVAA
ncbi:patatin-like phospholipase family protein [Dyadobacter chenwenxiniae]|uniref:Patatin-like phospholipase family protein n=1 Tax=Dyadobacter chenwenxiniae TaxID=2906456 RepID=A0A9X1TCP7_9BACT|nr:patatin-like phospholipase family protein [Dyadobacter chenwenxiniae]MCF0059919.1 patatin-like phospholipase family protein [Dyadobacter chenwenxiniae]UON85658.1 patatin-like phospholipase family protein [Dyadobacter chenwenxiniae]